MRLINALTFLTIVPVLTKRPLDEADFGRATTFYPLVGAIIGGLLALLYLVTDSIWSTFVVNVLIVAGWAILTGGLHLDGLSDTADGFLAGKTRDEKLAIMKDSRIGAYGVIAICLALLLKVALLGEMEASRILPSLVLAPVFGRWAMVFLIHSFPTAHTSSLGQLVKQHSGWLEFTLASVTALIAGFVLFQIWGAVSLFLLAGVLWLIGGFLTKRLGGLTGDNYGAVCELCEVLVLLCVSLSPVLAGGR